MLARDIMTREVITVGLDAPVEEVARLLLGHRISGVPVVDATGRVVGVVTEADLIVRERPDAPAPAGCAGSGIRRRWRPPT